MSKDFSFAFLGAFLSLSCSPLSSTTRQESWRSKKANSRTCVTKICLILFRGAGEKAKKLAIVLIGFFINLLAMKARTLPGWKLQNKAVSIHTAGELQPFSKWLHLAYLCAMDYIYFIRFTKLLICLQLSPTGAKCISAVTILSFNQ